MSANLGEEVAKALTFNDGLKLNKRYQGKSPIKMLEGQQSEEKRFLIHKLKSGSRLVVRGCQAYSELAANGRPEWQQVQIPVSAYTRVIKLRVI